jgi:hypothetical protein
MLQLKDLSFYVPKIFLDFEFLILFECFKLKRNNMHFFSLNNFRDLKLGYETYKVNKIIYET